MERQIKTILHNGFFHLDAQSLSALTGGEIFGCLSVRVSGCHRKTVLEYGFHALREEKKARYIAFRDSLLQTEKQQEQELSQEQQEKQDKLLQQQQQKQARQAEEDAYFAQQQAELASRKAGSSKSSSVSQQSSLPEYSHGMVPPTPNKKPYEEYNNGKKGFFGMKKKGNDLAY